MSVKRLRGGEEAQNIAGINMANVLMLLSRSGTVGEQIDVISAGSRPTSPARVFECKTCSRQFPSFQALGGHRASHKKPRLAGVDGTGVQGQAQAHPEIPKPRVHECSVCGLEFAIGQALGGHMRRHRVVPGGGGFAHGLVDRKDASYNDDGEKLKRASWLDLNAAPEEEAVSHRQKIFGFELVGKTPMVDWLH